MVTELAGLLTDSRPDAFPTYGMGQWLCRWFQDVDWSFTAAGLSGIYTRFPFIVFS